MLKVGDRVRTLRCSYHSKISNEVYADRTGTITEITHPVGGVACYKVVYDEPFYYFDYEIRFSYFYDGFLKKIV